MTPAQIVRARIPDADDSLVEHIVWGMTPFPFEASARIIYRAASRFVRAGENGIRLCDCCPNRAADNRWACDRCAAALTTSQREPK